MSRGVRKGNRPVSTAPDHFPVRYQNRPYRNFPFFPCPPGFFEGYPHELLIFAAQGLMIDGRHSISRQSFRAGKHLADKERLIKISKSLQNFIFFISFSKPLSRGLEPCPYAVRPPQFLIGLAKARSRDASPNTTRRWFLRGRGGKSLPAFATHAQKEKTGGGQGK